MIWTNGCVMKQRITSYPKSALLNGKRKNHVCARIIVPP